MNESIEKALMEIEIPAELHERAVMGIEQVGRERKISFNGKRAITIAIAAVLVVCMTVAGGASHGLIYKPVIRDYWNYAPEDPEKPEKPDAFKSGFFGVIEEGWAYEATGDEFDFEFVETEQGALKLNITIKDTTKPPFDDVKQLQVTGWTLHDGHTYIGHMGSPYDTGPRCSTYDSDDDRYLAKTYTGQIYILRAKDHEYTAEIHAISIETNDGTIIEVQGGFNVVFNGPVNADVEYYINTFEKKN